MTVATSGAPSTRGAPPDVATPDVVVPPVGGGGGTDVTEDASGASPSGAKAEIVAWRCT